MHSNRRGWWMKCWPTGRAFRTRMSYEFLFAILFALALIAFLVASLALSRSVRPGPRHQDLGNPIDSRTLVGGLLWHVGWLPWRVTAPMAELRIFERGVLIGPSHRWLGILVPTWALNWSDLASVHEKGSILELSLRASKERLRFSCFSPALRRDFLATATNYSVDTRPS
jgi:hypothetical protein